MSFTPPVRDLLFAATELADLEKVRALPGCEEVDAGLIESILAEAGKLSAEVLAPLNRLGDQQGAKLVDGEVVLPEGWQDAYQQFIAGGWNGLPFPPEYGGQGLPWLVASAVHELMHAANMAFGLCPLLTQSAVEALLLHASDDLKARFAPKMVSGEWTGTMNLTEPQAGSDLSAVATRAEPCGDHYLLKGQKMFITYGDHALSENIIHMVLARLPDAPEGVKGISLFLVPKYLPGDGEFKRNEVKVLSLEHKIGIHASPTALLQYGEKNGAVGYLVGEANRGLSYMFTMMNVARHAVGVEANGVAERAYQQAAEFAKTRVQGRAVEDPAGERVAIIRHPDIRRLLLLQKSRIEAVRSLSLFNAAMLDVSSRATGEAERGEAADWVEVLTPIVKGYGSEAGLENVSCALQIHGGMGFIEETGAGQHYRDQRITPIYEGTTGIQALDLIGRKLTRGEAAPTMRVIDRLRARVEGLGDSEALRPHRDDLLNGLARLKALSEQICARHAGDARLSAAVAEPYLRLWGVLACGWQLLAAADCAEAHLSRGSTDPFYRHKLVTAQFYFTSEMPKVDSLARLIEDSAEVVADSEAGMFGVG